MSSIARQVKTYSKRRSNRNSSAVESPHSPSSGTFTSSSRLPDEERRPKKRRTLLDHDSVTTGERLSKSVPRGSGSLSRPVISHSDHSVEVPTVPSSPIRDSSQEEGLKLLDKGKGKVANGSLGDSETQSIILAAMVRDVSPSPDSIQPHPSTPKKPKDLSRIFEAASPQRKTSLLGDRIQFTLGKSGITKNMLSRSKTESSIESSSPKAPLDVTPKAQSFVIPRERTSSRSGDLSPSSSPKKQLSRNPSLGSGSVTPSAQHAQWERAANARTYAGHSRSFLVALPTAAFLTGEGVKQGTLGDDDDGFLKDSYSELRKRYGVDNSEGLDPEAEHAESLGEGLALYNPLLSSITDLRSKGETRRFRDEVGYIFEGLEPNGVLSIRRSSALDIVSKLSDTEFWKKARAAGLVTEVWDRLRGAGAGNGDKVLDSVLCCFIALASEDPRDIASLASSDGFIETIVQLMIAHATNDPLTPAVSNGKGKSNKAEMIALDRLRAILSEKNSIIHQNCEPSTRLLLSCSLSAVPSLAFPHLSIVLDSVNGDLASVCNRLAAYKSGLASFHDLHVAHEKLCFDHIYNCLAILDLYLIEADGTADTPSLSKAELRRQYRVLPNGLVALIVVSDILSLNDSPDASRAQVTRCSELAFRILINLTNGDPTWADAVIADPFTLPTTIRQVMESHRSLPTMNTAKLAVDPTAESGSTLTMDRLCLSLALLTNLLQERDDLAFTLQSLMVDPACSGQRSCLLGCRCANSISAVFGLVNVYISFLKSEDIDTAPDVLFLRGHLAVLVGLLLLQLHNPVLSSSSAVPSPSFSPSQSSSSLASPAFSSVHSIIDALPGPSGPSGRRGKLNALIENVDAFSELYASLTTRVGRANNSKPVHETTSDSGGSDDSVVSTLQRPGRNGARADSGVVAGIGTSLHTLCDELCHC